MRNGDKTLVVVPYNLFKYNHGNAVRVRHMIEEFQNNNLKVSLFMYDLPWIGNSRDYYYKVKPEIVLIAGLFKILFKFSFYDLLCATLGPVRFLKNKLEKAIEKEKIGILQVENLWPLPPIISSLKKGVPVVVTVHDVYSVRYSEIIDYVSRTPEFIAKRFLKKTVELEIEYLNKADAVVCLTEEDKQKYASMGIDSQKLKVIPGGVDVNEIKPTKPDKTTMKKYGIKNEDLVLFFIGSLMYQNKKAIDDIASDILPRILEKRKNVKMLIAGSISKYVKQKGYDKKFPIIPLGYVKDVNQYYAIVDIVLIPTFLGTGFKTKTLEAMAAGKPVVCNYKSSRGIKVENWKNVVICDDFDEMVEAILFLDQHEEVARKLGENARITAEKYDWRIVMRGYIELYEKLLLR